MSDEQNDLWGDIPQPAAIVVSMSDSLHAAAKRISNDHPGEVELLLTNPNEGGLQGEPEVDAVPTPCPDVNWLKRESRFACLVRHIFPGRTYPRSRAGTVTSAPAQGFLGTAVRQVALVNRIRDKAQNLLQRTGNQLVYRLTLLTACGGGGNGGHLPMNEALQSAAVELQGAPEFYAIGVITRSSVVDNEWRIRREREAACLLAYSAVEASADGTDVGGERRLMPPLYQELYVIDGPEPVLPREEQQQYVEEFVLALLRPGLRQAIDQKQVQWGDINGVVASGQRPAIANPGGVALAVWSPEDFAEFATEFMAPDLLDHMTLG